MEDLETGQAGPGQTRSPGPGDRSQPRGSEQPSSSPQCRPRILQRLTGDFLAELGQRVEQCDTLRTEREPLSLQRGRRDLPAVTDRTEHVGRADLDAVEEDLVELRLAVHLSERSHVDAGATHGENEARQPAAALFRRSRSSEEECEIGVVRAARPHLLTLYTPATGDRVGSGREPAEVGTGSGLREELTPKLVAAQD